MNRTIFCIFALSLFVLASSNNVTNGTTTLNTTNSTASATTNNVSMNVTNVTNTTSNASNMTENTTNSTIAVDNYSCNNPFLRSDSNPSGIPGLESPIQGGVNIEYCPMLQNQAVCCEASVINNLTNIYEEIRRNLTVSISNRDMHVSLSKDAMTAVSENIKEMVETVADILKLYKKLTESGPNFNISDISNMMPNISFSNITGNLPDFNKIISNVSLPNIAVNFSSINKTLSDLNLSNIKFPTDTTTISNVADATKKVFDFSSSFNKNLPYRMLSASLLSSMSNLSFNFMDHASPFSVYFKRTKEWNMSSINILSNPDIIIQQMKSLVNNFKSDFIKYQKERKECVEHLLKEYTKFVCLGCSSNPSLFYFNQKLQLQKNFCNNSMAKCYNYLSKNELFSGFESPAIFEIFANVTRVLKNLLNEFHSSVKDVTENPTATSLIKMATLTANFQQKILSSISLTSLMNIRWNMRRVPHNCNSSESCQYICENFLTIHGLDMNNLINPGVNETSYSDITNQRLLESSSVVYSDNGYNVENVTSGVEAQVSFSQDPAGTSSNFNQDSGNFSVRNIKGINLMILGFLLLIMVWTH